MYIKKQIPIENENSFSSKTYELLSRLGEFSHLKLDTSDKEGFDVGYDAVLQDGSKEELNDDMSISQFLQFIKQRNPKTILRVATSDEGAFHAWDDYKEKNVYFTVKILPLDYLSHLQVSC